METKSILVMIVKTGKTVKLALRNHLTQLLLYTKFPIKLFLLITFALRDPSKELTQICIGGLSFNVKKPDNQFLDGKFLTDV